MSLLPVTFPPLSFKSWHTQTKAKIPYGGEEKDIKIEVLSLGRGILVPHQNYFQIFKHCFPVLGVVEHTPTRETETGGLGVQGYPWLHIKCQDHPRLHAVLPHPTPTRLFIFFKDSTQFLYHLTLRP